MIKAQLSNNIVKSNDPKAYSLEKTSYFGNKVRNIIEYSVYEAMYLVDTEKIEVFFNDKKIGTSKLEKKFNRIDKKFEIKYAVYCALRKKGHVPKTALKFGAEFRVYKKGSGPGKGHSEWIVYAESESSKNSWHDFSAKNRVAHSTNKKLLLAIVDSEKDVLFFEVDWKKI